MLPLNNLGSFSSGLGYNSNPILPSFRVGRVIHVITSEKSVGYIDDSDVGSIYILDYNDKLTYPISSNGITEYDIELNNLTKAKPAYSYQSYLPLVDELVIIQELPSYNSDVINKKTNTYYLSSINLFNNTQHNSQGVYNLVSEENIRLGEYINEFDAVPNLLPFEGDYILNSRWGAGIRFSHTFGYNASKIVNYPWKFSTDNKSIGNPITLIVNGYNQKDKGSLYIENINDDYSSIYLTSTQTIENFEESTIIDQKPTSFGPKLILPNVYGGNSQIILNSDRIFLNSKNNDVLVTSKTNIELGAGNTIHLNGKEFIYLNSNNVYLGNIPKDNNGMPDISIPQKILLGENTQKILVNLIDVLSKFCINIQELKNPSLSEDSVALGGQLALSASELDESLEKIDKELEKILSSTTYVS